MRAEEYVDIGSCRRPTPAGRVASRRPSNHSSRCGLRVLCGLGVPGLCGSVTLWPVLVVALFAASGCRRAPAPALPPLVAQVSGSVAVAGLTAPVRIVRDTWGVPHIYARNQDDLFFAQGFTQAQDRLFQMDLWRRSAQGRLSEVLGPNFIERDAMTRRMQYRGDLDAEWASYGPDMKAIAEAFVRGVNAWVALARERSPEEFVLAGWKPELWSAMDLLNRTDAFVASGDAIDETFRARLIVTVGLARARQLLPEERTLDVLSGVDMATIPYLVADAIRRVGTPPFFLGLAAPVVEGAVRMPSIDREPARPLDQPSPRYLVHLIAPGWNVIGATAPWRPGVAEGHNERIAWTAEHFEADTQDVYVEKVNPANPHQVEDAGRWVDIDTRKDWIAVRGRKAPVDFARETTRHGVIVASDRERHLAFAVRWAGAEAGTATELASPAIDRATSLQEFRSTLARWKMPARTMTYADADGQRGFQVAALAPVRLGWTGATPAPGWSAAAEWTGWKSLDDLPHGAGAPNVAATDAHAASRMILEAARLHPDRADAWLQALSDSSSSAGSIIAQRAVLVDALAEALRDGPLPTDAPVLFAHPLGVTDAARRRFNVAAHMPAGARRFAITSTPADWDRSVAMNAPGQSGSLDSGHYADLVTRWAAGEFFPLAFSERAVQAAADATLILTPR